MNKNLAIIQNPLAFMVESYMKYKVLLNEYEKTKITIVLKNELPYKIFLSFESDDLCKSFINIYNEKKFFEPSIDYKLVIELNDLSTDPEKMKLEILKLEENKIPYKFEFPYDKEYLIDYVIQPEKTGLLYKNEEAKKKTFQIAKYYLGRMGKNIIEGNSILNISLPIFIFDKRTLHQAFCHEHRFAPYYLTRAAYSPDVLDRLKWVTVHLISFLHLTTTQKKPFNPIIGETFQCRIGNLKLYLEQTANHPITENFYGIDDDGLYKIFGYQITDASANANTCIAKRIGLYYIKFIKDNTTFRIRIPDALVKGITFGDRLFSYENKCLVIDITNRLCSFIEINPEEKKDSIGGLSGFFKVKKTNFPDFFQGHVVNSKYVKVDEEGSNHSLVKGYHSICKISGEWTNNLKFDDDEYWKIDEEDILSMYHDENYRLPSDGSLRTDLICLENNKEDASQKEKERLEQRQRDDRKLRAEWANKNKK